MPLGLLGMLAAERLEAVVQDAAKGLADDVAGDEGGRVERPFLLAAAGVLSPVEPLGEAVQLVAEPLQVGDRLLEDVAEDIDVDELGAVARLVGCLVRRPVVVGGEILEIAADLVGDGEPVEIGIVGEQPAVVGRDVQGGVADVDRTEQAPEILPDRPRVVGIVVLVGFLDGLGGQQPPILAEGAEQDAVEKLLRAGEHLVRADGRVRPAQVVESVFAHVGVADVELLGQLAADFFRGVQQLVEVARPGGRDDPLRLPAGRRTA